MRKVKEPIGRAEAEEAQKVLARYRQGKRVFDRRVVEDEQWYRLRHWDLRPSGRPDDPAPASAWLFNSLANKHGDMMDNYPSPAVLPREPADAADAAALSAMLPVLLERSRFEEVYARNAYPKLRHGTACYGVFWDTAAEGGLGDVRVTAIDVLNLYWEPGVHDLQDSRNLFYLSACDNELLEAAYPTLRGRARDPVRADGYKSEDRPDRSGQSTVVDWYYKKTGADGKTRLHYAKLAGSAVLYATENDPALRETGLYDHGQYPFVLDVLFPMPDSPAGFGYVDLMKGPQEYIDQLDRILLRNARLAGRPRWFYRDSCGVNEAEFADFDRDFVHVAGRLESGDLRQIDIQPLPAYITAHRQSKIAELKETSGNRDFSQGGTSAGVTAASAIAALQEAGNKLSRDLIKGSYRAFTAVCTLMIELVRQFYDEARVFRITGEDGRTAFLSFGGLRTGDRPAAFDVVVCAQKANPFSQLSKNEQAKELYQLGFFRPDLAPQALAALEMMDFEGIEQVRARIQAAGQAAGVLPPAAESLPGRTGSGARDPAARAAGLGRPETAAERLIPRADRQEG